MTSWQCQAVLLLLLATAKHVAEAKRDESSYGLNGPSNFEFITRFCFVSHGQLDFRLEYPMAQCCPDLLFYYNSPQQWQQVRNKKESCAGRSGIAKSEGNFLNLSPLRYHGCHYEFRKGTIVCNGSVPFRTTWHTWWFFALSDCDNSTVQLSSYNFHMVNSPGTFTYEFSADEFGILETNCAFLILYFILVIACVIASRILKANGYLHTSYQFYMVSLFVALFSLTCSTAHYGRYSIDGVGYPRLNDVAELAYFVSFTTFLFLLLMLAKGWTVTRGRIRDTSMYRLLVVIVIFVMCYMVMFIWYKASDFEDHALYMYASPPGYGLVAMYFLIFLWFCYAIFFSVKNFETRRTFFQVFFLIFMPWFLLVPISILIMAEVIPDYQQRKVINGITWALLGYGHITFMAISSPASYAKHFPYHIKTNQIAAFVDPADRVEQGVYNVTHNWCTVDTSAAEEDATRAGQVERHRATVRRFVVQPEDDGDAGHPPIVSRQSFLPSNAKADELVVDGDLGGSILFNNQTSSRNLFQSASPWPVDTNADAGKTSAAEATSQMHAFAPATDDLRRKPLHDMSRASSTESEAVEAVTGM